MATIHRFVVGDPVELRDAAFVAVGAVVALMRDGHAKVAWTTGQGYEDKTIMLSVRALRIRDARGSRKGGPRATNTR